MTAPRLPYQLALAVACGLLAMHLWNQAGQASEVTEASNAALALHPKILQWEAKLMALETSWRGKWQAAAVRADSLERTAPVIPPAPVGADTATWVAANQWKAVAEAKDTALKACSEVVLSCEARAKLAEAEADTLMKRLAAQVTLGTCHINLGVVRLACPSRTVLFVGGVVAGYGLTKVP